jgi:putative oxidoreductase
MMSQAVAATVPLRLREHAQTAIGLLERVPFAIVQLMARLAIAAVFWRSAQTKIASWEFTVFLFRDEYQVPLLPPEVAAFVATSFELLCPVLLVFGILTRLGTLPLLGMTMVIQLFVYPQSWPEHLTWAALLLLILTRGPGPISLDHLIGRYLFGRKAS